MKSFDVIVVGAGGSGLAAALSAAQHGASVLVLEKQPNIGGTTGIAVGSFTASGTSLQKAAGIEDDPRSHAEDAGKFAPEEIECRNCDSMREFFLSESAKTLEWLRGLGLSFVGPHPEPPNRQPRMHNVVPGAKAYIAAMQLALAGQKATLLCNAGVESLLRDGDRVVGVTALVSGQVEQFGALRGVILAAGDYASSGEMIAKHKGQQYADIDGINPFACGDGQRLASSVRAQLLNMDVTYGPELRFVAGSRTPFVQWLPASGPLAGLMGVIAPRLPKWIITAMIKRLLVTWQHPEDSLFDDGAILVNRRGERFVNERVSPEREIELAKQPDKEGFLLLDRRLIERYSAWPHFVSTAPDIAYAYVGDYQKLRPDVTHSGDSLPAACRHAGIESAAALAAVRDFNEYVAGNGADRFGRSGDVSHLEEGRCVLLGPVKAYFTTTEGGAAVTQRMEVVDTDGQVIPGLYAAGQNGLSGMILWSHGLHIAWAMTSGRLAGAAVMQNP